MREIFFIGLGHVVDVIGKPRNQSIWLVETSHMTCEAAKWQNVI